MKNKHAFISYLIITLFLATSCTPDMITENNNGSTVEYSIGSSFKISLKGNPEKGFMWKAIGLNNGVVQQIGDPEIKTATETGKELGTYIFTFKTKSAGNTKLRLIYFNKNAENSEPEDEFEISIISGTMGRIES